jgi:DNA polymerase III epsilon subunit-like protein
MPESWFARLGKYLGGWPDDYLVADCETQGLDPYSNVTLPLELGWCLVEGRQEACRSEVVLDWTRHRGVDRMWLAETLDRIRAVMEAKGYSYPYDLDYLADRGVEPREALREFRRLLADAIDAGYRLVGHNFFAYDRPLLVRSMASFCRCPLEIPAESVLDTGMIEKARMLKLFPPAAGELPLAEWYSKVRRSRRRVKWNLSQHCAGVYGIPVEAALAHGASYDCRTNHILLERMRQLAAEAPSGEESEAGLLRDAGP